MVELCAISKDYGGVLGRGGVRAVSDVSLTIKPGLVTGLLGPNGAGKTTLIRIVTGLLCPTQGTATVCGFDTVTQSTHARACVGYLPEFAPLYPEMTARSYLRFRAGLHGIKGVSGRGAVEIALKRCWLTDVAEKRIGAMSKGYRQRVGLAAAILHGPKVLVLDEPTTGLDPTQIRETRQLLRELANDGCEGGRVVLLSSHILPEVEATCDRIVIVAGGRVRAQGTPVELMRGAGSPGGEVIHQVQAGRLTTQQQFESFAAGIALLDGVAGVSIDPAAGVFALEIRSIDNKEQDRDLRERIAMLAAQQGLLLIGLTRVQPTLERVFMRAVQTSMVVVGHGEQGAAA